MTTELTRDFACPTILGPSTEYTVEFIKLFIDSPDSHYLRIRLPNSDARLSVLVPTRLSETKASFNDAAIYPDQTRLDALVQALCIAWWQGEWAGTLARAGRDQDSATTTADTPLESAMLALDEAFSNETPPPYQPDLFPTDGEEGQ